MRSWRAPTTQPGSALCWPAPGWRAHDVVTHLVGVIEDGMAGRLDGPPDDVLTPDEVRRHWDVPHDDLLHRWDELASPMEAAITDGEIWPAA